MQEFFVCKFFVSGFCFAEIRFEKITLKQKLRLYFSKEEKEMTEGNKKKLNWKGLVGVVALAALIVVFALCYNAFREKPVEGSKSIVIEVVNKAGESTEYPLQTDAEYLQQAMDEAAEFGLTYVGEEGPYGLSVPEVNGEVADYNVDQSYWAFYVNDEYCNYGISAQPVEDGDTFSIVYTVYSATE